MNHKITIDQFRKLKDPNTTRDEYDDIHVLIIDRIQYILELSCEVLNENDWDILPGKYGHFDAYEESDYIKLSGNSTLKHVINNIPVKWLWEDFEK